MESSERCENGLRAAGTIVVDWPILSAKSSWDYSQGAMWGKALGTLSGGMQCSSSPAFIPQ